MASFGELIVQQRHSEPVRRGRTTECVVPSVKVPISKLPVVKVQEKMHQRRRQSCHRDEREVALRAPVTDIRREKTDMPITLSMISDSNSCKPATSVTSLRPS